MTSVDGYTGVLEEILISNNEQSKHPSVTPWVRSEKNGNTPEFTDPTPLPSHRPSPSPPPGRQPPPHRPIPQPPKRSPQPHLR